MSLRIRNLVVGLTLTIPLSCGGSDSDGTRSAPALTPGEKLCKSLQDYVTQCGAATPCDTALVQDCASIVDSLSEPFMNGVSDCINRGEGSMTSCLSAGFSALTPTRAHTGLAASFCSECAFGAPGCEDAFFSEDNPDTAILGKAILPFSDSLVNDVSSECATGLGCAGSFLSCTQGVIAKRAIPESTVQCLVDNLTGQAPPPPAEQTCVVDGSGGAGGMGGSAGAGGIAGSGNSGGSAGNAGSGGGGSGGGGGGAACVNGSDCASHVCDPATRRCIASECVSSGNCGSGKCVEQVEGTSTGVCAAACQVSGAGCNPGETCVADLLSQGVCLPAGSAGHLQDCAGLPTDTSTGCAAGHVCAAAPGESPLCYQTCDFWVSGGCPSTENCTLGGFCEQGTADPANLEFQCASDAEVGDPCGELGGGQQGGFWAGVCAPVDSALYCVQLCRLTEDDCFIGTCQDTFGLGAEGVGGCF